jgi:hypothetical protein
MQLPIGYRIVILVSLCFVVAGCSGREKFPVAKTSGTVTCEGKAVPNAIVYFEPVRSGDSAMVGDQGFGLTDANGVYTISTYGEKDGAVVGKHIIRVGKTETSPPCNCSLNASKVLKEVEIKTQDPQTFDLVLVKKERGEKDVPIEE